MIFQRSTVPVKLIRIKDEILESRDQAKDLLASCLESGEILLDFNNIDIIGVEFADEIFRVFRQNHPEIVLRYMDTNRQIEQIINKVSANHN